MKQLPGWGWVLMALLCVGAGGARAQGLPPVTAPGNQQGGGPNAGRRAQVQQIMERYKQQRQQLRGQIQVQRQELAALLRAKAPPAQTQGKLQGIIASEGQLEGLILQEYYELCNILPPKAQDRYTERIAEQVAREHRPNPNASASAGPPPGGAATNP